MFNGVKGVRRKECNRIKRILGIDKLKWHQGSNEENFFNSVIGYSK